MPPTPAPAPATLNTPTNVELDNSEILTWDIVEGATSYTVRVTSDIYQGGSMQYTVDTNMIDLFTMFHTPTTYTIQVHATADDYLPSAPTVACGASVNIGVTIGQEHIVHLTFEGLLDIPSPTILYAIW